MAGQIKVLEKRKGELQEKVKELQESTHVQMEGKSEYRREMEELVAKN